MVSASRIFDELAVPKGFESSLTAGSPHVGAGRGVFVSSTAFAGFGDDEDVVMTKARDGVERDRRVDSSRLARESTRRAARESVASRS